MKHALILCGFLIGSSVCFLQAKTTFAVDWKSTGSVENPGDSLYSEEEISFVNGNVRLSGTLSLPKTEGPYPAVVLLTMGGPQTRDEESFGFKMFKVIADHLTKNGNVVLRYDDRGVGGSTGNLNEATLSDLASDAFAAVTFLKQRPEIDATQIGLLGHSQGGIVAPLAASRSDDIAFVILMGGPVLSGAEMALETQARMLKSRGATEEQIAKNKAVQKSVFSAVRGETPWKTVEEDLRKQLEETLAQASEEQIKQIGDVDAFIRHRVETQLAPIKSPLFASFLDYNTAEALASISVPVLALFGGLDTMVPVSQHKSVTETALKKAGVDNKIHVFPAANHQFQAARTGDPAEYANLEKAFVAGFLEQIAQWIKEQTHKKN